MAQSHPVALITGGTKGIGRSVVLRLVEAGMRVAFCAREAETGRRLEDEIRRGGGEVSFFPLDISSDADVQNMVQATSRQWGSIDILINNAGILGPMARIEDYPVDAWQKVIRINILGTFLVTHAILPLMRRQNRGRILFITSSLGRKGRALWGGYTVSKFAMEGLMQTLADETSGSGIRVMAFNPAATRTTMRAEAYPDEDPGRLKPPSDVAEVLYGLIREDQPDRHGRSLDFDDLSHFLATAKKTGIG